MRDLSHLDEYRVNFKGIPQTKTNGMFHIKIKGETYLIVSSIGDGWEHVSISHQRKIPSWSTMCALKDLFFEEHEAVMQLHPAKSEYVNNHARCLHLWKPMNERIPLPPAELVGIKGIGPLK